MTRAFLFRFALWLALAGSLIVGSQAHLRAQSFFVPVFSFQSKSDATIAVTDQQVTVGACTTCNVTVTLGTNTGAGRYIIVTAGPANGPASITSITINSVAATIAKQQFSGAGNGCGIAIANVTSGTTGVTITGVMSSSSAGFAVTVYEAHGLQSATATATAGTAVNNTAVSLANISAGGIAVACNDSNGSPTTDTWTGLTDDGLSAAISSNALGSASKTFAAAQTSYSVTGNINGGGTPGMAAASFR